MNKKSTTYLMIIVFLIGVSLLLYPAVSDYWNSFHQSYAIAGYAEAINNTTQEDYDRLWSQAQEYNRTQHSRQNQYILTDEQRQAYEQCLNIGSDGMMGYIEIPRINCHLPIYHGTDENILQVAIGHLEWSSLPVGGESTHCVLSGHRGLPSAKLFSNLDQLSEGDIFILRVLDEVLTYEVDQILIVLPEETAELQVAEGMDYCSLVTCTPYGINTHRILVRGHRVENQAASSAVRVTAEAALVDPLIVAAVLVVPLIIILFIIIGRMDKREREERSKDKKKYLDQLKIR